jgi:hypothetical protein
VWLAAVAALLVMSGACALGATRTDYESGLALLTMAGTLTVLALLAGAVAFGTSFLFILAVTLAGMIGPSTLIYTHFLERWE